MYNVLAAKNLKVQKEDQDSIKESIHGITKLINTIRNVEDQQEGNREKFKVELDELIPKLSDELAQIAEKAEDPKFLSGDYLDKI